MHLPRKVPEVTAASSKINDINIHPNSPPPLPTQFCLSTCFCSFSFSASSRSHLGFCCGELRTFLDGFGVQAEPGIASRLFLYPGMLPACRTSSRMRRELFCRLVLQRHLELFCEIELRAEQLQNTRPLGSSTCGSNGLGLRGLGFRVKHHQTKLSETLERRF